MISYSFISDLFISVLLQSPVIGGRFFISAKNGQEINSDLLGEVLKDTVVQVQQQKYPLALMIAPTKSGELTTSFGWQDYNITMLLLTTTFYDPMNQIADVNPNTQTSLKPVLQNWEEMDACANDFIKQLDTIMRTGNTHTYFRLKKGSKRITPVSMIGIDRASGVRLDFAVSLFNGCDMSAIDITQIVSSATSTFTISADQVIETTNRKFHYPNADNIIDNPAKGYVLTAPSGKRVRISVEEEDGQPSVLFTVLD